MKVISRNPESQQGASIFAIVVMMVVLGLIILSALKLTPPFLDNQIIEQAVSNLRESGELEGMSQRELRTYISRTMQANAVVFDTDGIALVEDGGTEYVQVEYESRVEMFFNVDAVVKFDYRLEL